MTVMKNKQRSILAGGLQFQQLQKKKLGKIETLTGFN